MADDSVKTVRAMFATREAADRAIELLVQQCAVARADIFVQASEADNSAGTSPSGGDTGRGDGARADAPLHGEIEVSADVTKEQAARIEQAFREAGAHKVAAR
jgi:hypothetical protein